MVEGKKHPYLKNEMELLLMIGNGNDVGVIALRFNTTVDAIYTRRRDIAKKYGVAKVEMLVFDALEKGWILLDREVRFMGY